MKADRWEAGSAWHWCGWTPAETSGSAWTEALCSGTGRHALSHVVESGRRRRGWRRLWIPSYFCQKVVAALRATGMPLAVYEDRPGRPVTPPETGPGDALLVHSAFGLRAGPPQVSVDLIEDHTHSLLSPWPRESRAAYCIASLRKLFPMADGALAWSPSGGELPPLSPATREHLQAAAERLQGMILKARYLDGWPVEKAVFRSLLDTGEAGLATREPCAASPLALALTPSLPFDHFARLHQDNHRRLVDALAADPRCRVLEPQPGAVPYCAFVLFHQSETRDRVREQLRRQRIYASALWPLDEPAVEGITEADRSLSARSFCLPVDARYGAEDMIRIAEAFRDAQ